MIQKSKKRASSLMLLGTASGVGKSAICAALCRIFQQKGMKVSPFKAQNISLNSGVTPDGKEIARSQALQALAAGIPAEADMNPILLKPEFGGRLHVLLRGEHLGTFTEESIRKLHETFADQIQLSYERLTSRFDMVVVEGMGGAGEINLFDRDLANFRVAEMAEANVLLVGNIEAGGVFASLYGTWALCPPRWRRLIRGFLINQLRGDANRLGNGPEELYKRTGVPVVGAIPHFEDLRLDAEDALDLERLQTKAHNSLDRKVQIAVIRLPHLSNSTDFEPFLREPFVHLFLTDNPEDLSKSHAVILPGSKCVASDLAWMKERRLDRAVRGMAEEGKMVVGLCGGYQMLGAKVYDPNGMESSERETSGLGILPVTTTLVPHKVIRRTRMRSLLPFFEGEVEGYEIHMGESELEGEAATPAFEFSKMKEGILSEGAKKKDGNVFGTYLHGLFENDGFRRKFLELVRKVMSLPNAEFPITEISFRNQRLAALDRWSELVEQSVDLSSYLANISSDATSIRLFSGSRKNI